MPLEFVVSAVGEAAGDSRMQQFVGPARVVVGVDWIQKPIFQALPGHGFARKDSLEFGEASLAGRRRLPRNGELVPWVRTLVACVLEASARCH